MASRVVRCGRSNGFARAGQGNQMIPETIAARHLFLDKTGSPRIIAMICHP
jgi:hypothetical protein